MGFLDSISAVIGSSFVALGLESPISRALAFGTVGFAAQYFVRPGISYVDVPTKGGNKCISKQFSLLATKESSVPTTWFPWYFWPILFALIGGIFL